MDNKQYQEIHEDLEDIIGALEGKTLLITGASGFLGVWFAGFLNFLKPKPLACYPLLGQVTY